MDVQGERGHYSFTDNTSLLTDLCSPAASDKPCLSQIMMTARFLLCVQRVSGTERGPVCPFYSVCRSLDITNDVLFETVSPHVINMIEFFALRLEYYNA